MKDIDFERLRLALNEVGREEGLPEIETLDFESYKQLLSDEAAKDGLPPLDDDGVWEVLAMVDLDEYDRLTRENADSPDSPGMT